MKITKAIIPVAGWGTRRLPITKAIEKCMLPIGNVPVIDFVVRDCIRAGITDIYFVVSGAARQLRDYYSRNEALEAYLRLNSKERIIPSVIPPKEVKFHYVTQDASDKYGTTVAVWLCREYVDADEQVLVIMGDQFFYREDGGSNARDLMNLVEKSGGHVGLFGVPVPLEEVYKYGVIEKDNDGFYKRIIEHPKPEEAPSNLNNASFYLFDSKIFKYFEQDMARPHTGEYMIIDPINQYVADGNKIIVGEAKGEYLDAGSVRGWLHANQVVIEGNVPSYN
jgi:UTP--glucose-1-phosphate uridylyltransferase